MRHDTATSILQRHPGWIIAGLIAGLLVLSAVLALLVIDEPLRAYLEEQANRRLPGYRIAIGALALHPLTLSVELHDVTIRQKNRPEPPLAIVSHLTVEAKPATIFSGIIGGDIHMAAPVISVTEQQIERLLKKDGERLEEQTAAWQEGLRNATAFYATLAVTNGQIHIYDEPGMEPIHLHQLELNAVNLTNRPKAGAPSPIEWHADVRIEDQARMEFDGRVDVFAAPLPRVETAIKVHQLRLEAFGPILRRRNIRIHGGTVDLSGTVSRTGYSTSFVIDSLLMEKVKLDFVHAASTGKKAAQQVKQAVEEAAKIQRAPSLLVKIEQGRIRDGEIGFINTATSPDYRIFLSEMNLEVENFSNRLEDGAAVVKVYGRFMGSGPTVMKGVFRPEKPRPDFDLEVKITKTHVPALNKLLQAYGNVDVVEGTFAFFCELSVKNNQIDGYVKPFLKDVEMYDPKQDRDKALAQRIYEAVVGGILDLLKNTPRQEVATKTDLSGPVENPHADTWEIVEKLVQNAFFKAILPGFEKRAG